MTKSREKISEELTAEIEDGQKKIRQFENREKILCQKLSRAERRERNHCPIVRGAAFESIVPEAKGMADELLSGAGGNTATKTEQAEKLILDLLADGKELASEEIEKAATAAASPLTVKEAPQPDLVKTIGGTTIDIHIHFSETSRETFTDKVVRLIQNDSGDVTA